MGEGEGGGDLRDYFIGFGAERWGETEEDADEVWHLAGGGW
jgi:hypothetical protein